MTHAHRPTPHSRLADRLGVTVGIRQQVIKGLFTRTPDEVAAYWLQLGLAIGIATLGLVMGSSAVIIGAMLVAPLMGPIVELALSLLIGAGSVMIGSAARVILSMILTVGSAAIVTAVLPFNEPSAEILARTSPTVLDLVVAMCCAVAAAFVTARPGGSAASTAAGTSIGISLVPPLCTVGFGVGTGRVELAEGALLLFVANFSAILACATVFFWLVGFRPLPPAAFEGRQPVHYGFGRLLVRLGERLDRGIASRFHLLWRLVVPLALVLAVSVPLARAYAQMAWQVRTRSSLARMVGEQPRLAAAVTVSSVVEFPRVAFRAVVVGDAHDAEALADTMRARIQAEAGVTPLVSITAVPRATAAVTPAALSPPPVPVAPAPPTPDSALRDLETAVTDWLATTWPAGAGRLVSHGLTVGSDPVALRVVVLGPGLEPTATALLESALGAVIGRRVAVTAEAIPTGERTAPAGKGVTWLAEARPLVTWAREVPTLVVCVTVPPRRAADATAHTEVASWMRDLGAGRVAVRQARHWMIRIGDAPCG